MDELVIGAVAYTANVVPIWEGIRDYFRDSPVPIDFVLFSNYERQVDALVDGQVDLAWNTNVAYVRTVRRTDGSCRALAMRDTDLTFQTLFVARAGSGIAGLPDLRGRRVALGSRDSAQARILPAYYLQEAGLEPRDVTVLPFDSDVGKHGDTGRSELDALRAVLDDEADVAAMGVTTWAGLQAGDLAPGALEVVWTSPEYCHCNFTALDTLDPAISEPWVEHLLAMDWDNPAHRPILEMEGLRRWVRPELAGYESLFAAMDQPTGGAADETDAAARTPR
jgi:ABC-type phosphate/phosphonate transport system substrate-binding protein